MTRQSKRARLTASVAFVQIETGRPLATGSVRCRAEVGGKRLRVLTNAFKAQAARCAWKIPAWAKGKQLTGVVAVQVGDDSRATAVRAHGQVEPRRCRGEAPASPQPRVTYLFLAAGFFAAGFFAAGFLAAGFPAAGFLAAGLAAGFFAAGLGAAFAGAAAVTVVSTIVAPAASFCTDATPPIAARLVSYASLETTT